MRENGHRPSRHSIADSLKSLLDKGAQAFLHDLVSHSTSEYKLHPDYLQPTTPFSPQSAEHTINTNSIQSDN